MKATGKLKRGDFIMLLLAAVVGLFLFLWRFFDTRKDAGEELIAEVRRDGQLVAKIDLNKVTEPEYIRFEEGIKITIVAERGRIRFDKSECPDQICVRTGWLTAQGDTAACLPAKTIVTL